MEPRIQYAKTSDGVSIAYLTLGEGEPLVYMPPAPYSHADLGSEYPSNRRFYELISQNRKLITFDARGAGLSTRDVTDCSLDAQQTDLQAVVDSVALDRFALAGMLGSARLAIVYAIHHPERVSQLILIDPFARPPDVYETPEMKGLLGLLETNWEMYTETVANVGYGWAAGEPARRFAAYLRQCTTQEVAKAYYSTDQELDLEDALSQVRTPTLIIRRRGVPWPTAEAVGIVASKIPEARLVMSEGTWLSEESLLGLATAIDEYLGEGAEAETGAKEIAPDIVHTILFTDVEGSTPLTERLGDAKARELLREHERIVRDALKTYGGSEVKTMGDGFMTSFGSATKALECAIAIQRAFAEHNDSAAEPIQVRIGLNAGEPIAEDEDLFGTAVNMAARICSKAEGGQILAPIVVRELVAGKGFLLSDVGETELRGFEDPVRLYDVRWRK